MQPGSGLKKFPFKLRYRVVKISWRDLFATAAPVVAILAAVVAIALHFVQPAPPSSLTIGAGRDNSVFRANAEKYKTILARDGITLIIRPTGGSLDNLERLTDPNSGMDVAFIQGGMAQGRDISGLESLGSVFHEPLFLAYRAPKQIVLISELTGKRIAIGPEGSGTRVLALALLKANHIEPGGTTTLLDVAGDDAETGLESGQIDAAFLMGDTTNGPTLRKIISSHTLRLYDFPQAEAYSRRFRYLEKLEIPAGTFDLGGNVPPKSMTLLAPTVELVARSGLHPALSDLLLAAAQEVHGHASVLQQVGEFPAPLEHEYAISEDASRFYKSGKSLTYKHLPFWLASLVNRILVVVVPVILVLIPGLPMIPSLYKWRIRSRIDKCYGELMALERTALTALTTDERNALLARLDEIENSAIINRIPGGFADQNYILREHIQFVRQNLARAALGG